MGDSSSLINVAVDDMTYIGVETSIKNTFIGKFCSIGPNCTIGLGKHPSSVFVSTHPSFFSPLKQAQLSFTEISQFQEFEDITIGNDVWIGANVTILDGVNVSDGAIIATGSIVTKDVPAYAIVAGIPSQIIKYRFSKKEVEFLSSFKWWDKSLEWLKQEQRNFLNIDDFINMNKGC